MRPRPSPAMIVAVVALIFALIGTAAATQVLVKRETTKVVAEKAAKKKRGPAGPPGPAGAAGAQGLQGAQGIPGPVGPSTGPAGGDLRGNYPSPMLAPGEGWHVLGQPGEPDFLPGCGWSNLGGIYPTVGYYRDPLGIVHLKGVALA